MSSSDSLAQVTEPAWDGLDALTTVLTESQVPFSAPDHLDLSRLTPDDAVLIVSPRQSLPVQGLTTFLREGGRVALFDDVGAGDRLLSAYQVSRVPVPAGSAPALRGDPSLLIAYPASEHPLVAGVSLLLTNRASELRHPDLRPVFTFGRSHRALMLAGAVGGGRLVAVGDGSVLINQLMAAPSHRRFASNLVSYLARPNGRIWLVGPNTTFEGSYGSPALALSRLENWLKRLARPDFPPAVLWLLSVALAGIALVVAAGALPRRSPYVSPELFPESEVFAGFAGRIAAVEREGVSLLWPLLDYRRELEAELTHRLSLGGGFERAEALQSAKRRGLSASDVQAFGNLLDELESLAAQGGVGESKRRIRVSELRNVVRKGEELLAKLGNDKT
ncbi:MAG: hypothetical protein QM778_07570 [Myxococcales bacterium]